MIETTVERTDKDKEIINNVSEKYNILQNMLNKEQLVALQEYDNALLKVSNMSERNSFIIGFNFATRVLFEALYENKYCIVDFTFLKKLANLIILQYNTFIDFVR